MESGAGGPVFDFLVVDHDVGLGEKGGEAVGEAEVGGGAAAVVGTAGAPEVEFGTGGFKTANVVDDLRNRNAAFGAGADEGFINIDVNDHGFTSVLKLTVQGIS